MQFGAKYQLDAYAHKFEILNTNGLNIFVEYMGASVEMRAILVSADCTYC